MHPVNVAEGVCNACRHGGLARVEVDRRRIGHVGEVQQRDSPCHGRAAECGCGGVIAGTQGAQQRAAVAAKLQHIVNPDRHRAGARACAVSGSAAQAGALGPVVRRREDHAVAAFAMNPQGAIAVGQVQHGLLAQRNAVAHACTSACVAQVNHFHIGHVGQRVEVHARIGHHQGVTVVGVGHIHGDCVVDRIGIGVRRGVRVVGVGPRTTHLQRVFMPQQHIECSVQGVRSIWHAHVVHTGCVQLHKLCTRGTQFEHLDV